MPRAQHLFQFDTDHLDEEEVEYLLKVTTHLQDTLCNGGYISLDCVPCIHCKNHYKCKQIAHLKLLLHNRLERIDNHVSRLAEKGNK